MAMVTRHWIRLASLLWVVVVLSLVDAGAVTAARLVVLDSSDPDYLALGTILDNETRLDLPDGVTVTLMDETGRTARVVGPYSGVPGGDEAAAGVDLISPIAALLGRAVRGARDQPPTDPWMLDVGKAEDRCVRAAAMPTFWRAEADRVTTLTLKRQGGDRRAIEWPSGAATLPWPEDLETVDGAEYAVQMAGQNRPQRFTLHVTEAGEKASPALAAWMAQAGCQSQANVMLITLEVDKIIRGWEAEDSGLF